MALTLKNNNRIHANHNEAFKELMKEKETKLTFILPSQLKTDFIIKTTKSGTNMTEVLKDLVKKYIERETND